MTYHYFIDAAFSHPRIPKQVLRQLKPKLSLLRTFPQQSIVDWTRIIPQIVKVLVTPFKLFHSAREICHDVRVSCETFDCPRRKRNPLIGTDGGYQLRNNILNELSVIRSRLAYRVAIFGCPDEHVRGNPDQFFKHRWTILRSRNDVTLEPQRCQSIGKCQGVNPSGSRQTFRIHRSYPIHGIDSQGRDAQVQESLRVGQQTLAFEEIVEVPILEEHQIAATICGTFVNDALENIIPRGDEYGTFSVGIDGGCDGIVTAEEFGIVGDEGTDAAAADYDGLGGCREFGLRR
mmetsp:Transcript_24732/g.40286  ORF Transcript_24732/g.40286 Transcript_24732/m.40286 type:complete len:290 (-) Transcript_24732:28-897(-)